MKNKKTVSVYIPAYNEENNISFLLKSILRQKGNSFTLKRIVVVDDGSTDRTREIVLNISRKFPIIKLLKDNKRIGKIDRLNQIYKINKSEILILFDGDLILKSSLVIENMIKKFNKGTSLVSANKIPLASKTLIETLINCLYIFFYEIRKDINNGENIHNFSSCAYAINDVFAKKLNYPKNIYPITKFTYFAAIKNDLRFKFAKDAYVYFRSSNNMHDYSLQVNRFSDVEMLNEEYYGIWIRSFIHIPFSRKLFIASKMLITNPFIFSLAIILRLTLMLQKNNHPSGRIWELATSSKKLI